MALSSANKNNTNLKFANRVYVIFYDMPFLDLMAINYHYIYCLFLAYVLLKIEG
jgi:hypothetical protein